MARNPSRYAQEFYDEAQELFGLDREDARELRSMLHDAYGFDWREQSLSEYAVEASDLLDLLPGVQEEIEALIDRQYTEEVHREYDEGLRSVIEDVIETESLAESPYDLDPDWDDDEWLDADDWYEVTGEYEED